MNNIVLSKGIGNSRSPFILLPLLYPAICTSRAASLNSAIHHGIRRSKGVGFRGKERSQNAGRSYEGKEGAARGSEEPFTSSARSQMRVGAAGARPPTFSPRSRNGSDNSRGSESTYGKKGFASKEKATGNLRGTERVPRSLGGKPNTRPQRGFDRSSFSKGNNKNYSATRDPQGLSHERHSNGKTLYPSLSGRQSAYGSLARPASEKHSPSEKQRREHGAEKGSRSEDSGSSSRQGRHQERRSVSEDGKPLQKFGAREAGLKIIEREHPPRFDPTDSRRGESSPSQTRMDSRMPISIPYTTPASEFLYGTSVVEAALRSRRVPRRKHYKLYIYNGANRDGYNVERDAGLERMAVKTGVEVVRVSGDWLRVMDKMSGGRPHNGYILEASPLPRTPILSLGEVTSSDGQSGFRISLDHQSREEAAVNGTADFIKFSTNVPGRKPLVLLLDSIVDPGNLGGIIRTASFLGVTAIAVSTRNSASFTPVVLKASAGASENVTLFSVNKPAGFLVDSKAAGWKIYAAVAPSGSDETDGDSVTTDELEDPLSQNPCILMLGGEGEGLRSNLRSKADVYLSITGSGRSHKVDSLNVSVAAGILCNSFLRRRDLTPKAETKVDVPTKTDGDLF
ncbi:rRNA methyltransferase [Hyphodiscus hymeniophilus]|uniref:rRNA methyltransferase 1, mitochondrial n=1 Tax=Hyphodiscus hymeniophilus TaxID=353542 RepID=A0A9P6SKX3_9HELO|nr:rRNA methyltransferase [Hyphodiscus hymeniophilus]